MKRLVVVGNGMAGMACLEQILKHQPRYQVTVFGDETHVNYNRIMLSAVLAGEKAADDIVINVEWRRSRIDLGSACASGRGSEKTVPTAAYALTRCWPPAATPAAHRGPHTKGPGVPHAGRHARAATARGPGVGRGDRRGPRGKRRAGCRCRVAM
jgi:hypothetical protein